MITLAIDQKKSVETQFNEAKKEWKEIKLRGNDTKCWTDGQCMNLIRAKMIQLRSMMRLDPEDEDISRWKIPEKVDFEFNHRQTYKKGKKTKR